MSITVLSQPADDGTDRRIEKLEQEIDKQAETIEQQEAAISNAQSDAMMALTAPIPQGLTRDDVSGIIDERLQPLVTELEEWRNSRQSAMSQSVPPNTMSIDQPENSGAPPSPSVSPATEQNVTLEPETVPTPKKPTNRFKRMLFHRK